MLESVHGIGALLKQGWRPKRTIVFCSWTPRKRALSVSTEWLSSTPRRSTAPLPTQHGCSSLRPRFLRRRRSFASNSSSANSPAQFPAHRAALSMTMEEIRPEQRTSRLQRPTRNLRTGTCRRPRLGLRLHALFQHVGVPSTDVSSGGPYGVYHSVSTTMPGTPKRRSPLSLLQEMAVSSASRLCAWPMPTCCPTTMWPTPVY